MPTPITTWETFCGSRTSSNRRPTRIAVPWPPTPTRSNGANNLGYVLRIQGKLDEAVIYSERARALRPDLAEPYNNLGNVLMHQGRLDKSIVWFEQALALKSDYADAHSNLANVLVTQGKLDQAEATTTRPCRSMPAWPRRNWVWRSALWFKATLARLARLRGAFASLHRQPQPDLPRWQGEPLAGRNLLLLREQGLGDTIHFLR